ncbi:MAG: hypothetical protein B0W54_20535 [Cellvibrio sp. 79]|nr:MAG: hypothetical protein B0W54_20535 [Cellvibrio sp. 79]
MFWIRSPFEKAAQLGGFVLAHSALILSELQPGELICPFSIIQSGRRKQVFDYEAESQEEAVERGKADFDDLKDIAEIWAFAREGLFSGPDVEKTDVIVVSAWAPGMAEWLGIIQKFNPPARGKFGLIGEAMIFVNGSEAQGKQNRKLNVALSKGILDRNVDWDSWKN